MASFEQPEKKSLLARLLAGARRALDQVDYYSRITAANLWRSQYNPIRSLTIAKVALKLEAGERGAYADLQWTYRTIEKRDPILAALVDRRLGAIQKLDWDVRIPEGLEGAEQAEAERQQSALHAAFERISNLTAALGALAHATFRGYAHLQILTDETGQVSRLDPIPQWFWVREGVDGPWRLNLTSELGVTTGEDPEADGMAWVVREVERPINEVALIAFVRKGLSQKDWDAFVEVYGVPAIFVIMPPELGEDKRSEYQEIAEAIVGDGRGVLPGGSEIKTVDNGARGVNPFRDHIKYQDECVVIRATGGMLTMLTGPTGMGSGVADVQEQVFRDLASAEAAAIAEILNAQLVPRLLPLAPGVPRYAYWVLEAQEETDPGAFVEGVAKLNKAGYTVDPGQIEEKTGYTLQSLTTSAAMAPVINRAVSDADLARVREQFPASALPETSVLTDAWERTLATVWQDAITGDISDT